ncbi:aminotransferase class I/II-fold pyridoxal phosphate-dependent enzyme [uncultured Dokdonia sp.]|uniref:aminotransferase class I/II-fold pyridoxal phosphate-dependent enzyme n=1 Tax=uncultured Dokdonia sp. TaxID=575653 RepID=UPI00262F5125|nr:aminotransferase class I/II-fold pyridoxal phosphate-dependent enzyme [uncultured Dokdonia sp.]
MSKSFSTLSKRGNNLATTPARIDSEIFIEASQNLYCPIENPNGSFPLNIAENHLMASKIKDRITLITKNNAIPDWVLNYTHLLGNPDVRMEIATFMEAYLCGCPISHDTIGLSAGASAVIEASSFVLANTGDVVVIPAPSYPMYTNDLGLKSDVTRYDLQTHYDIKEINSGSLISIASLEQTWDELKAQGKRFKILLITSPDNPTGYRYNETELKELAHWCIEHEVHMIVNEIYALSLIETSVVTSKNNEDVTFSSFAKLMNELKSDYLHLWYAFSKDFAMSGLRIGVVHSLNEAFIKGFENVNVPHLVSNLTQWVVGELLKDNTFLKPYIAENKLRLTHSYKLVIEHLEKINVPYYSSKGSFFVWADFSQYLEEKNDEGEKQLWLDIYKNTGVLLTPGIGFMHQKKGCFRIVFTAVPFEHLEVSMHRMTTYFSNRNQLKSD